MNKRLSTHAIEAAKNSEANMVNDINGDPGSIPGLSSYPVGTTQPDSAFIQAVRAGEEFVRSVKAVAEHEKRTAVMATVFGELMEKADRYYGVAK